MHFTVSHLNGVQHVLNRPRLINLMCVLAWYFLHYRCRMYTIHSSKWTETNVGNFSPDLVLFTAGRFHLVYLLF